MAFPKTNGGRRVYGQPRVILKIYVCGEFYELLNALSSAGYEPGSDHAAIKSPHDYLLHVLALLLALRTYFRRYLLC